MELSFQTRTLRDLCESRDQLNREFGADISELVKLALADMRAASTIYDLVAWSVNEVTRGGTFAQQIDLGSECALVFCPNHIKLPKLADSKPNWAAITRIRILMIGNVDG